MEDSLFTKIVKGEVPCYKVYEDDRTLAFLDIHPDKEGHTLVITKVQVDQYLDLSDEDYQALWLTVKKVAERLKKILSKDRVRLAVVGTDVPHVHVHLIPFNENDKSNNTYRDNNEPDHSVLAEMAEKLVF